VPHPGVRDEDGAGGPVRQVREASQRCRLSSTPAAMYGPPSIVLHSTAHYSSVRCSTVLYWMLLPDAVLCRTHQPPLPCTNPLSTVRCSTVLDVALWRSTVLHVAP